MKTIRLRQHAKRPADESLRTSPASGDSRTCIGAHADYRREDFVFRREQSLEMRAAEWESRLKPIRPWGSNLVANLAFEIFA